MRILLAEDELSLSKALVHILQKNNYCVDAVPNGTDALQYLLSGTYDAVILDIMMPGLDGIAVLKAARGKGIQTPVLLLTAKAEIDDKIQGLDSGANDYLTKPFDTRELLARLRAMTRTQTATDSALRFGNVTLDRATFQLSTPKGSYRLANKEFQILELLLRDPHTLVSTERILEKVWGYDSDAELSVVWVYISYLRKKLAALDASIGIKASRNAGYCLEETK